MIQRALLIETCNLVYIKADRFVNLPGTRVRVHIAPCMLQTMPLYLHGFVLNSAMLDLIPHTFRCPSVSMHCLRFPHLGHARQPCPTRTMRPRVSRAAVPEHILS